MILYFWSYCLSSEQDVHQVTLIKRVHADDHDGKPRKNDDIY